eukprot:scaffold16779_cov20-Tisochrysis_lutea.AAC.3
MQICSPAAGPCTTEPGMGGPCHTCPRTSQPIFSHNHPLGEVHEVLPQDVTQPPELSCAPVLQAELEGLVGDHGIQGLQLGVGAQDFQHAAVGLPQETEPGRHQLPVRTVLRVCVNARSWVQAVQGKQQLEWKRRRELFQAHLALVPADVAEHDVFRRSILLQVLHV